MYDFTDYLVATLSTIFILIPTFWGLVVIVRSMFKRTRP